MLPSLRRRGQEGSLSILLRSRRAAVRSLQALGRGGRRAADMVTATRGYVLAKLTAEGADIGGERVSLIAADSAAETRHAVRPAFEDRSDDIGGCAAVYPLGIHQRRTHAA